MNNPRLSETLKIEQQSEEHARPESKNTEKKHQRGIASTVAEATNYG